MQVGAAAGEYLAQATAGKRRVVEQVLSNGLPTMAWTGPFGHPDAQGGYFKS